MSNAWSGWVWAVAWALSFYPQLYLSWTTSAGRGERRRGVRGLNHDFLALQCLAFAFGMIWSIGLYDDEALRADYAQRYNFTVGVRDVFLSAHNFALSAILLALAFARPPASDALRGPRGSSSASASGAAGGTAAAAADVGMCWFGYTIGIFAIVSSIAVAAQHVVMPASFRSTLVYAYLYSCMYFLLWVKFLPQCYYQWVARSTAGLSPYFVLFDAVGSLFLVLYTATVGDGSAHALELVLGVCLLAYDVVLAGQFWWFRPKRDPLTGLATARSDDDPSRALLDSTDSSAGLRFSMEYHQFPKPHTRLVGTVGATPAPPATQPMGTGLVPPHRASTDSGVLSGSLGTAAAGGGAGGRVKMQSISGAAASRARDEVPAGKAKGKGSAAAAGGEEGDSLRVGLLDADSLRMPPSVVVVSGDSKSRR